jgi:hypothetical protein
MVQSPDPIMTTIDEPKKLSKDYQSDNLCRIWRWTAEGRRVSTLWVSSRKLKPWWIAPLYKRFDIIFGTSTGAIIAALIALGFTIDDIHDLYKKHVPTVMSKKNPAERSRALGVLTAEICAGSARNGGAAFSVSVTSGLPLSSPIAD